MYPTQHELKFNHRVFLGNLLTRSTNVIKFHSPLCSLFPAVIFVLKISQIFENPRFSFSSENSTVGPKRFINISSKNRTVSQVNSTICHFGWRTTIRQHLSRALLYPLLRTLVLAPVVIALGTYVATNSTRHLTNSFSSSGHPFVSLNLNDPLSAEAGSL